MNVSELVAEPGAPDFHRRFVLALKRVLSRPETALIVATPAALPDKAEAGAMAWVQSLSRLAVYDGGWKRTDTGGSP